MTKTQLYHNLTSYIPLHDMWSWNGRQYYRFTCNDIDMLNRLFGCTAEMVLNVEGKTYPIWRNMDGIHARAFINLNDGYLWVY